MNTKDLKITVIEIRGKCSVYSVGDSFYLKKGFVLTIPENRQICMHSLSSIMPYHVALSHNVSAREVGLSLTDDHKAILQCLDPCDFTGGGTVILEVEVLS
ncbi:MAG: TIGR04076 family protein [bacterium]|nr:TIGR04076 family protein [bacterium]